MKKYLIFLLFLLISVGANAATINLTFGTRTGGTNDWYEQEVTDAQTQLRVGDMVLVSYSEVTSGDCQYAICNKNGNKIYTNGADVVDGATQDYYTCPMGDKDFTFTVDQNLYNAIYSGGLVIQEKGLNTDGKMTISVIRITEDWSQYKPANATEIMSTPQYIKDWYNEGYVLTTSTDYIGKTLRVVCLETGDDSYAFLKEKGNGDPAIMSGSDKFSIAGWKYFEIKINSTLNALLRGNGLRIGGNNYYIAGIYVYGNETEASDWKDEESDIIDDYVFQDAIGGDDWVTADPIPGSFFEYHSSNNQISTEKIANTKNNIIRFVFESAAGSGAQVSAKDNDGINNAGTYIRQRNEEKNDQGYGTGNYYYVNYADVKEGADHFDFELSDAITVFKVKKDDGTDNPDAWKTPVTGEAGVKKGMLSTLLQNGMQIGAKNVKIKHVQIRKSMASKYITGYAEYVHPLSKEVWRPIALPYNLTRQQVETAFGSNVMICDLGASNVTKTKVMENGVSRYVYRIVFNFENVKVPNDDKTADYLNANYPYIIKIKDNLDENKYHYSDGKGYEGPFVFANVKADVRDFQAYEFRTGSFTYGDATSTDADKKFMTQEPADKASKEHQIWEFEQNIKNTTQNAYLVFQSTAPVFNITNTSVGEVEHINGVTPYTSVSQIDNGFKNYFFYDGALWPVEEGGRNIKSGLAYVRFPEATYNLFNEQNSVSEVASFAKIGSYFSVDDSTTGIEEIVAQPKKQNTEGIYSLGGQLIRKGTTTDGLAKGIYIVNGKKVIVNQ